MRSVQLFAAAGVAVVSLSALTACGKHDEASASGGAVEVNATDTTCEVAKKELPAGTSTFKVTNKGTQPTEFEVKRPDGRIVAERENIGPGTGIEFTTQLQAGKYVLLCSPGMTQRGPSQQVTVTGNAAAKGDPRLDKAVADYRSYVMTNVDATLSETTKFVAAFRRGDVDDAKDLYPKSRTGWEAIEPVAESFGDIDPKVDAREADLAQGQTWTGWHRLEKTLWAKGASASSLKAADTYADGLITDLETLKKRVGTAEITPVFMANGAKELLDEVATGKITGEEEVFSHTDLWDFKANVDGADKAYTLLRPVVRQRDAALANTLDQEFVKVGKLLAKYKKGDGYVSYDTVGERQRKELSDEVNALGEPLSQLAKTVTQ